jgi:hypothetical protein
MDTGPREIGRSIPLGGSPLADLTAQIGAELAAGAIPCGCPHPVTASRLFLPARILCCTDCDDLVREVLNAQPSGCAICSGPATRSAMWLAGRVLVMARLCETCGTTGNTPLCLN